MTTNIENLRAELEAVRAKSAEQVNELTETGRLRAEIDRLTNPALQEVQARMKLQNEATTTLRNLVAACEEVVTSMPDYNARTRQERKYAGRKTFGMGNQVALVYQLLTGIQYATEAHKAQMMQITGLNEDLVESTLESFGSPSYYSSNHHRIIPETPFDVVSLHNNLAVIETTLGITLDKSKLTEQNMRVQYDNSIDYAQRMYSEAEATAELQQQSLLVGE